MMMDEQTALGDKGAPFTITFNGVTYPILHVTQKRKAEFVKWAKQQVVIELGELREVIGEEEYKKRLDAHIDRCTGASFAFDNDDVQNMRYSDEGVIEFTKIILGPQARKLTEEQLMELIVEKGDEIETFSKMNQAKMNAELKLLGHDPDAQENKIRGELTQEQLKRSEAERLDAAGFEREVGKRIQTWKETLDPKVQARCLRAAGLLD